MDNKAFDRWKRKNENDARVLKWIAAHPPPEEWTGTPLEYAFVEMPVTPALQADLEGHVRRTAARLRKGLEPREEEPIPVVAPPPPIVDAGPRKRGYLSGFTGMGRRK